jgi:hypothetical protein
VDGAAKATLVGGGRMEAARPDVNMGNQVKAPTRKSLEDLQRENDRREKLQVLAQPHRRGNDGYMTDGFGTFLRREFWRVDEIDLQRQCWDAGQSYIRHVARLRRAETIPQRALIEDETPSNGGVLDEEVIAEWRREIKRCEFAMKCSGVPGFRAANNLVLEDVPPEVKLYGPVKRAIIQLAICLGVIS